MKLSPSLPIHLVFFILSSLDEAGSTRADSLVSSTFRPNRLLSTVTPSSYILKLDRASNWTRRASEIEEAKDDVICHPAGSCEPCPDDLLQEPFCQPFGNRRLLHCLTVHSKPDPDPPLLHTHADTQEHEMAGVDDSSTSSSHAPPSHHPASRPPQSALPAWESCGRRVPKERADFFEFVLCNVIFVALALTGVLVRSERMRVVRARRLAARIGVGLRRASSGTWAGIGDMTSVLTTDPEEEGLVGQDASGS